MKRSTLLWAVASILIVSALGRAQGTSTIVGTVTDPSGAVVPRATVTATEVGTRFTQRATTDAGGYYVLSSLRPTDYNLIVEAAGFRRHTQTGITLLANQSLTINIQMEVGAVTQEVTVTTEAPQVDTYTPTLSQVVDEKRAIELPLNGRNAAALTTLVAGTVIDTGIGNDPDQGPEKTFPGAITLNTNGSRQDQTVYLLDGANHNDNYTNLNQPFPFPDALQEFSIQTANYSAEYGNNAGAVVNVVTKTGTNALHGDLFEFNRNAVFNARNFFEGTRDQLKRNQFGGTVGGPIYLPRLYDGRNRTFFFFGYQGTEIRNILGTSHAFVPTQANLAGDFSSLLSAGNPNNPVGTAVQLIDPATGQPYAGNQIDPKTFDPVAVNVATNFLPRATGTGLVFYPTPFSNTFKEFVTRVDHSIRTRDQLSFRFYVNEFSHPAVFANKNLLTDTGGSTIRSQNHMVRYTHAFRPNLLNDFAFDYIKEFAERGADPTVPNFGQLGVKGIYEPSVPYGISQLQARGYFQVSNYAFAQFIRNNFAWTDNLKWVHGGHDIRFGASAERARLDVYNLSQQGGRFIFSGDFTGTALADYLLGRVRSFSQDNGYILNDRVTFWGFFAQDTYKVNKRLTVTGGLRWEPFFPWKDKKGRMEQFRPQDFYAGVRSQRFPNAPPGLFFPGDPGFPGGIAGVNRSLDQFAPRVGFAYDLSGDGKTSLRGGAGIFYDTRVNGNVNIYPPSISPWSIRLNLTNPAGPFSNPLVGVTNPFPSPVPPPSSIVIPRPIQVATFDPSGRFKVPTTYNWNLTLEHQLRTDWMVRAAYVGTHTSNIVETIDLNPAVYIPGSSLGPDQRRLFPEYSDIYMDGQVVNSNYNALQLTLEKRFTRNLTILANYTYSKSLDTQPYGCGVTGVPNCSYQSPVPWYLPGFHQMDYGPSEFDHTHNFVVSYVWALPNLEGQNPFARGVLGNWELSGIVGAFTGDPMTVVAGTDRSQTALGGDRAVPLGGNQYLSGPCQNSAPCVNWLNANAFGLPAIGSWGTLGKNTLRGPGVFNWDIGIFKNFPIKERFRVQFRAEFFNIFNRVNFNDPGTELASGGFGQLTSARDPRIGQLALKVLF